MKKKEKTYYIKGLDCPLCAASLEESLRQEDGITSATIDFSTSRLVIEAPSLSLEELNTIANRYEKGISIQTSREESQEDNTEKEIIILSIRIAVSLLLALLGIFYFTEERFSLIANISIMGVAWLVVSYDLLLSAVKGFFKKGNPFTEDFLMVIASVGAFALRAFGPSNNEFFEGVLVVLLFQVGEAFEKLAARRSKKAIVSAIGLQAKVARKVLEDERILEVPPCEIQVGDRVQVRLGDLLPVDGTIISGNGNVDVSSLTGEFVPEYKKEGDFVFAGTLLKSGCLTIEANKPYEDNAVSKIMDLIESSSKSRTKVDRLITRFSRIYTPIVIVLALLVAVLPPLFIGLQAADVWSRFLHAGLSFLVISCPCAIVISVPLAFFAGVGLASKKGVVIKGSGNFDTLSKIDTVCLDKTGTLTKGDFSIVSLSPVGVSEEYFLSLLRAAEAISSHPIAQAILEGSSQDSKLPVATNFEEIPGLGVRCQIDGEEVLAGNATLLVSSGIIPSYSPNEGTIIHVAKDSKYLGFVALSDVCKDNSLSFISKLKNLKIRSCLLSGDKESEVASIAKKLGIEEWKSSLKPADKAEAITSLKEEGSIVAFVGDGINDAPSLLASNMGFAMGGLGSDLAIENADAIIMDDDPEKVVTAIKIAKKTERRAIANIVIALTIKLAFMLMAALIPSFPLYLAVFGDTGLTVLLCLNSLLLLKSKVS